MVETAGQDLKVALGLLDVRHVAGDPNLTLRLRTTMLTEWRRDARERLRALQGARRLAARPDGRARARLGARPQGDRGRGARRDRAQGAGGHVAGRRAARRARAQPARAARHARPRARPGRPGHRPDHPGDVGRPRAAARRRRRPGRPGRGPRARPPDRAPVPADLATRGRRPRPGDLGAPSVADAGGRRAWRWPPARSCWTGRARPAEDPALLLRAAAAAAERDVVLAPPTAARLARECAPLPTPWPAEARDLLVRLLASGRGLLGTWETLEETGALCRASCPSGSGSGCCRTPPRSTASPSTGTSSRPASRPRR